MTDNFENILNYLKEDNYEQAKKELNQIIYDEIFEAGHDIAAVKRFLVNDKEVIRQYINDPNNLKLLMGDPEKFKDYFIEWLSKQTNVPVGLIKKRKDVTGVVNKIVDGYSADPDLKSAYTQSTDNNPNNGKIGQVSSDPEADVVNKGAVTHLDREKYYGGGDSGSETVPGHTDDENYNDDPDIAGMNSTDMLRSQNAGVSVGNKTTKGFRHQSYKNKH